MSAEKTKPDSLTIIGLVCVILCLVTWGTYLFHYAVNPDNAVLAEFARRMLAGGKLGTDFIDINPPLSIILYIPAALISNLAHEPLYNGITLYALLMLSLSVFLSGNILKRFSFLRTSERVVFLLAFTAASLAMGNVYFAGQDQLILCGLLPLLLAQFAILEKVALPRWLSLAAVIFGAALIQVEPHYILIPVIMIGWRIWERKNLKEFLQPDFFILAAAIAISTAINTLFFADWWHNIFPDITHVYTEDNAPVMATLKFKLLVFTDIGFAFWLCMRNMDKTTRLMLMMAAANVALVLVYLAQAKGYYYQLLPGLTLTFASFAMLLSSRLNYRQREIYVLLPAMAFLFVFFPVKQNYPTNRQYAGLPLGLMLKDCKAPCSFYVYNDYNYMTFETALETGAFHASRFSTLWFQPALSCGKKGPGDADYDKYAAMITEDFQRWKPQVLMLLKDSDMCADGHEQSFNFAEFFSRDKNFAKEFKNYEFSAALDFDRAIYFPNTAANYSHPMEFEIYKRKGAK